MGTDPVSHLEILRPDAIKIWHDLKKPNHGKYGRQIRMNLLDFEEKKEYLFYNSVCIFLKSHEPFSSTKIQFSV